MNKEVLISYLAELVSTLSNEYSNDFDFEYSFNEEIIDCQLKLYMLMLTDSSDKEFDNRFKEFEESYSKLSEDKKEFIRKDILKIFEERDKNNKKKEKIL